jgi:hypothetical protein
MDASGPPTKNDEDEADFDRTLAITAESLFLANLLLIPVLAFLIQIWLRWYYRADVGPLARNHMNQTFFVSLWGGFLLVILSTLLIALGGLQWQWTWVVVILYFTCVHSTLVLLGLLGLSRAMAGRLFRYPLIGPRLN